MSPPRILVLGSNGGLGRCLERKFAPSGSTTAWTRTDLDLEQPEAIAAKLSAHPFDVLINPAGLTSPDVCEVEPEKARLANDEGPRALAEACHARGARLVHFSTDYVFSGKSHDLWREHDEARPANIYGRTKRDGELAVLKVCPDALVARVSWLFGPTKASHPDTVIQRALETEDLSAVADKTSIPTSNLDVCEWIEGLLQTSASGVLHLCNSGVASWHSWAEAALKIARKIGIPVKTTSVRPIQLAELTQLKAPRPLHTVMSNEKLQNLLGREIRNWSVALEDYLMEKHRPR
ncbi:MAG: dTDP-4-dehydrorhamnose reductase [Prosthecobacter sp.]|uniref:dTDP-4-dehydrorhamnose reductase n=1 Tax=Prosthecobacter sp. TaxID=1965333 RepID=UPI0019ED6DD5|nr:dTDP-4-dehydrorhamnose reductase [Prosthecobacter sp.]MBE2287559.1 dTDP-4-dehydrorhamnose reductase [Prosthecobacter sp.]